MNYGEVTARVDVNNGEFTVRVFVNHGVLTGRFFLISVGGFKHEVQHGALEFCPIA